MSEGCSSDEEAYEGNVVAVSVRLLCKNRQLALVALAHGLQIAAADVAGAFDLGPDPYHTWREKGAAISSVFEFARNLTALVTAPFFGYLTDHIDRRWALLIYGFITFVPTWVFWVTNLNTTQSLWANHCLSALGAIGSTSQVAFALAMDVMPFEDRTLAAGVFYGLSTFVSMVLSPLLAFIAIVPGKGWWLLNFVNEFPRSVLIYQAGLVVAFVACVCRIRHHEVKGSEEECGKGTADVPKGLDNPFWVWLGMLKLLWLDVRLRRLCATAAIVSFCRAFSTNNNGQFFTMTMRLRSNEEFVENNMLRSLAGYLVVMPGFVLTGYLAMRKGTLNVLRWLVPLTAAMLCTGATFRARPSMWLTVVLEFLLSMTDLYEVPLSRLVAGVARPGRVGEWLSTLGLATEVAKLVGNVLTAVINTLFSLDWRKELPLWTYYPVCGVLTLLAILPILGTPKLSNGWGPAAGNRVDQLKTHLAVIMAARKWRCRVRARNQETCCPCPDVCLPMQAADSEAEQEHASSSTDDESDSTGSEAGSSGDDRGDNSGDEGSRA